LTVTVVVLGGEGGATDLASPTFWRINSKSLLKAATEEIGGMTMDEVMAMGGVWVEDCLGHEVVEKRVPAAVYDC
jgi:hypothetical protein